MKQEKDYTILNHLGYNYKISDDLLVLNDYYIDFKLYRGSSTYAIDRCNPVSLLNYINSSYLSTEPIKRLSAKIVASNDPVLNIQGIPTL